MSAKIRLVSTKNSHLLISTVSWLRVKIFPVEYSKPVSVHCSVIGFWLLRFEKQMIALSGKGHFPLPICRKYGLCCFSFLLTPLSFWGNPQNFGHHRKQNKLVLQIKYAPNPLDTNYFAIVNFQEQSTFTLITDRYVIKEHAHCEIGGKSNILWRHWMSSYTWKYSFQESTWTGCTIRSRWLRLKDFLSCLTTFSMILWFYKIWT